MSDAIGPEPALPSVRLRARSAYFGAASLTSVWLPFFLLTIFLLHFFEPIFVKLEERGGLPTMTYWFVMFARLNRATFGLPTYAFLVLVFVSDLGMSAVAARRRLGGALYWSWFLAMVLLAAFACLFETTAALQAIFTMATAVK
jgi:hypothetical protein